MNVLDAMAARRSVRAFGPRRPSRTIIESILKNAGWAPSIRNAQPWRVRVFSGDALADLVNAAALGEELASSSPPKWHPEALGARVDAGELRRAGLRFYEAPVGLICTLGRTAGYQEWLDHGCFVNSVVLAAMSYDLDTCVIGDFIGLEGILGDAVDVNDDEAITVGIGIGYSDEGRKRRADRRPLEDYVSFAWN